jgi:hypothetical protein
MERKKRDMTRSVFEKGHPLVYYQEDRPNAPKEEEAPIALSVEEMRELAALSPRTGDG